MASLNDIETKTQIIRDMLDCSVLRTITGSLPMTFRSSGTALINYKIYGTAEGAGVQTENLFNKNTITNNQSIRYNTGTTYYSTSSYLSDYIDVSDVVAISILISNASGIIDTPANRGWCYFDAQQNFISGITWVGRTATSATFTVNSVPENAKYLRFSIDKNIDSITLVKGSTPPETYIPYGYKLPLEITSGTESKIADIYIGDSKLLSSDYVDYESWKIVRNGTPQDPPLPLPQINTYIGINTLASAETLGEVTIKGKIKEVI